MDGLTYQQILAQQYEENVQRQIEHQDDYVDEHEYNVKEHVSGSVIGHELDNPERFQQFAGNRNLEEDLVKHQPFEDKSKLSVRYNKDVRTSVFNIDSRFRAFSSIVAIPQEGANVNSSPTSIINNSVQGPEHFLFRFNRQVKNAISIKLSSLEFPNTFPNFSTLRGNSCFGVRITGSSFFTRVDVAPDPSSPQYYPTPALLAAAVQYALRNCGVEGASFFACSVSSTGYIQISNSMQNKSYDFDFITNITTPKLFSNDLSKIPTAPQLYDTLGSVLGFSKNYSGMLTEIVDPNAPLSASVGPSEGDDPCSAGAEASASGLSGGCSDPCNTIPLVTGTYLPDTNTDEYIYIAVNDYFTVTPQTLNNTYFPVFAKIPMNVPKGSMVFDTEVSNTTRKIYYFLQPTNIQTLEIKLLDRTGFLLSNVRDYSLTLEIEEVVSPALYEKLREL